MIKLSLLEKIKQFFDILTNTNNLLLVTIIICLLAAFVLISCKMNDKLMKIFYIIIYSLVLIILVIAFHTQLLSLIDYLIENIVANLLFPNLAIYMGVLLFINIVVLFSIFSNKVKFYVKNINIIFFAITQLFLYLIIDNVIEYDVNVYEKLSIYTNENLLILVELSMQLFIVWLCVLGIIRLVDYFIERSYKNRQEAFENALVIDNGINEVNELKTVDLEVREYDYNNILALKDEYNYYEDYNETQELIEYVPIKKVKKSI